VNTWSRVEQFSIDMPSQFTSWKGGKGRQLLEERQCKGDQELVLLGPNVCCSSGNCPTPARPVLLPHNTDQRETGQTLSDGRVQGFETGSLPLSSGCTISLHSGTIRQTWTVCSLQRLAGPPRDRERSRLHPETVGSRFASIPCRSHGNACPFPSCSAPLFAGHKAWGAITHAEGGAEHVAACLPPTRLHGACGSGTCVLARCGCTYCVSSAVALCIRTAHLREAST